MDQVFQYKICGNKRPSIFFYLPTKYSLYLQIVWTCLTANPGVVPDQRFRCEKKIPHYRAVFFADKPQKIGVTFMQRRCLSRYFFKKLLLIFFLTPAFVLNVGDERNGCYYKKTNWFRIVEKPVRVRNLPLLK